MTNYRIHNPCPPRIARGRRAQSLPAPHCSRPAGAIQNPVTMFCTMVAMSFGIAGIVWAESSPATPGYNPKGKRDPFVALVRDGKIVTVIGDSAAADTVHPTLGGILWDPQGQSLALLNDTEVKVGDMVGGGYRVADIRQDAVVLDRDGEKVVLQITFEEQEASGNHGRSRGGERP